MSSRSSILAAGPDEAPSQFEVLIWVAVAVALLFHNPFGELGPEVDRYLLLIGIAVVGWSLCLARGGSLLNPGPRPIPPSVRQLQWLAAAWVGASLLTALLSVDPLRSLFGSPPRLAGWSSELALVMLFALALPVLRSARARDRLEDVGAMATMAMAIYGLAQWVGLDPLVWNQDWQGRPIGAQGNPLFLAQAFVWLLPILAGRTARLWFAERHREARLSGLVLLLSLAVAVRTGSRAALTGLVAAALVWLLVLGLGRSRRLSSRAGWSIAVVLIALAGVTVTIGGVVAEAGSGRTGGQRALVWKSVSSLLGESSWHRWIAGYGQESLPIVLPGYLPAELSELTWAPDRYQDRAHNASLDNLASGGVARALLALALVGMALRLALNRVAGSGGDSLAERLRASGILAALVGHLVALQTGIATVATSFFFWLALAALGGMEIGAAGDGQSAARRPTPQGTSNRWMALPVVLILSISLFTLWVPAQTAEVAGSARRLLVLGALAVALGAMAAAAGQRRSIPRAFAVVLAFGAVHAWCVREGLFAWAVVTLLLVLAAVVAQGGQAPADRLARSPKDSTWRPRLRRSAAVLATLVGITSVLAATGSGLALKEGRALLAVGLPEAAVPVLERATHWAPPFEDGPVALSRALLRLAEKAAREGQDPAPLFERAEGVLESARRLHPRLPLFALESAHSLARRAEAMADPASRRAAFERAIVAYRTALTADPQSSAAHRGLGAVLLDVGDLGSARIELATAARLAPRSIEARLLLGRVELSLGDFEAARAEFGAARAVDAGRARSLLETLARARPQDASSFRDLGFLDLVEGRGDQARLAIEHALTLAAPDQMPIMVRLLSEAGRPL